MLCRKWPWPLNFRQNGPFTWALCNLLSWSIHKIEYANTFFLGRSLDIIVAEQSKKENDLSAQGPVRIILRILCVDHTDAEAEDADDNDGTADSDGADDAGGVHCSDGADDADGGRNLGWPETSAHYPLIGGRALQLAGV